MTDSLTLSLSLSLHAFLTEALESLRILLAKSRMSQEMSGYVNVSSVNGQFMCVCVDGLLTVGLLFCHP